MNNDDSTRVTDIQHIALERIQGCKQLQKTWTNLDRSLYSSVRDNRMRLSWHELGPHRVEPSAVSWADSTLVSKIVQLTMNGNGYMTEAVNELVRVLFTVVGVHRVRSECDDTNMRSIRVTERCGFVKEGHFRKNKINPDGTYSGTLFFGMLREDFIECGK